MVDKNAINPYDSLWDWMAFDLRLYRTRRSMTLPELGEILGVRKQTINGYESGISKINDGQAAQLDEIWDTGGHFHRLHHFARSGHDPDWFKAYTQLEVRAAMIKLYEALLVPGLFQTPEYARAVLIAGGTRGLDDMVNQRIARQKVLTRVDPPVLSVLLDEGVIDRPVGGRDVMRAQLARLLELSESPNVMLRVVPRTAGAHVGLDGSFKIITADRQDFAFTEANGGGRLVSPGTEVDVFKVWFETIGADALPQGPSRALITQAMERMT
ncbi:helix-turn-helix transcriptional regulator [Actinoallomurus purpureus]|uniref:helix-turn-helix domain-containing protein n=1 Tax=Actinoallomurus purpureus TaxID=478114 RepID=UPI0020936CB5|nr:helix-turn-helix transcriptional regulator [Actinoallomurus purpureus]MCO6003658.1 helix-turn-helix transcriptional regulator [Actinoallomurus purpureus]